MPFGALMILAMASLLCGCGKPNKAVRSYEVERSADPPVLSGIQQPMATTPVESSSGAGIQWKVPTEWTDLGATGMRKGNFQISQDNRQASVTVTSFPGDVGGIEANIERWVGQISADPTKVPAIIAAAETVSVDGKDGKLYKFESETQGSAVCWVMHEGASWFFKMSGDRELIAGEQERFLSYLSSVKFGS